MKLLTFLGTANYQVTTYTLDEQRYRTCYCPAAVARLCRPDTTLVVVTDAAKAMHFEPLAHEIAAFTRPVDVPIPDGHSEADLWTIFDALTEQVVEGDELVVDITNGFRSLPFLSFLAVAFLRLARRVKVRHVYYGAYEARNRDTNESPIFDLTPFVTLLDWTIATDRFTRFGDATDLARLLRKGIPPGHVLATDLEARKLRDALRDAAEVMQTVSLALRVNRPLETMAASSALVETLQTAGPLVNQWARPFGLLAEQVGDTYRPLALPQPDERENWRVNLQIQLDLIERYLDQGQVVQAVTLAREWLVSLLLYGCGTGSLVDYKSARLPMEMALGNAGESVKKEPQPSRPSDYDALLEQRQDYQEIGRLWNEMTQLRNDIAHVGMRPNPLTARQLCEQAEKLRSRLLAIGQAVLAGDIPAEQGDEFDDPD